MPSTCPLPPDPDPAPDAATASEASGFGEEMLRVARHAAAGGAWQVRTRPAPSPDRAPAPNPAPDAGLSTRRTLSSIPKTEPEPRMTPCPFAEEAKASEMAAAASTDPTAQHWEYPSEAMYFRAMQRKGWRPDAAQMTLLVAIHNAVNEQTWHEVLQWEAMHATQQPPRLKHFMGKPRAYSPKARLLHLLRGSVLPFDRHDWIVERDGREVRYVIDYYSGQPSADQPLSIYLDVRPALDSVGSLVDRLHWQVRQWFPSLVGEGPEQVVPGSTERHSSNPTAPAACPHAS